VFALDVPNQQVVVRLERNEAVESSLIALAKIFSERPSAQRSAVSMKLPPASRKQANEVERGLLVAPPTLCTERHSAEAELRDPQFATAESAQAHGSFSLGVQLCFCAWPFKIGDSMKIVLAGFPRVGKTTVFQSLTGLADSTAARGAAARGIIRVPDARVDELSKIYRPKKTTYATVVFVDVQPPETGSPDKAAVLSTPLLAELKDADAVAAVVRGFPDPYSGAAAEPEREFARFDEELLFTDLAVLDKRLERLRKEGKKDREHAVLERLVGALGNGEPLRTLAVPPEEAKILSGYQLISRAPLLVVLNRSDEEASAPLPADLGKLVERHGGECLAMAGRIEREIAELAPDDQAPFLRDAGLEQSARDRFVQAAYRKLDLVSFLTTGEDEVRAWTITRGTVAQKAAGKIHSDIEKGFIRAEVIAYEDFVRYGSEGECRKAGKARLEGKEYEVADGDIVHFRFNV
jgi:GTP-binding protein YchF